MELLQQLGIDWKILIAQIINFTILMLILYKFVYKPVVDVLEKRSQMIEKSVEDAKKSEEMLKEIETTRSQKITDTEHQVGKLLAQAKVDADAVRNKIVEEAQKQSDDLLKRAKVQMEEEKVKMVQEIKAEVVGYAIKLSGKILEREFNEDNQKRLINAVEQEMKSIS